jgi:carboxyl-terminal processing protease
VPRANEATRRALFGYIRISQFSERTTDGLKKAISDLTSQLGANKITGK